MLTNEQRTRYLQAGGNRCPYCEGDDLSGGPFATESGIAWQGMNCLLCGRSWTDLYDLKGVREE